MEPFILVSVGVVSPALAFAIPALYRAYSSRGKRGPFLQDRINQLAKNLRNSVEVILEIENEVNKQNQLLERLRSDVRQHEQLQQLNEAQAKAVAQTIRSELVRGRRSSNVINGVITFAVALAFFVAGLFAGRI